jgi:hypothetical protein
MYKSTKEKAQEVRQQLKTEGITSKQVSIRSDSNSISIHIKDLTVSKQRVEEAASGQEHIRRCEASGEILGGGNTFVFVEFDSNAVRAAGNDLLETAYSWYKERQGGDNYGETIAQNDKYEIVYWPNGDPFATLQVVKLEKDNWRMQVERHMAHNLPHLAQAMAIISGQYGVTFRPRADF